MNEGPLTFEQIKQEIEEGDMNALMDASRYVDGYLRFIGVDVNNIPDGGMREIPADVPDDVRYLWEWMNQQEGDVIYVDED